MKNSKDVIEAQTDTQNVPVIFNKIIAPNVNKDYIFNANIGYFNSKASYFDTGIWANDLKMFCDSEADVNMIKSILDKDSNQRWDYKITKQDLKNLYINKEIPYIWTDVRDFFGLMRMDKRIKKQHRTLMYTLSNIVKWADRDNLKFYKDLKILDKDVTYSDFLIFWDSEKDASTLNSLLKLDKKFRGDYKITKQDLQNLYRWMSKDILDKDNSSDVFNETSDTYKFEVDGTGFRSDKKFANVWLFFRWLAKEI